VLRLRTSLHSIPIKVRLPGSSKYPSSLQIVL
jgi:hypothetical protein